MATDAAASRMSPRRWAPWTELLPDIAGALLRKLSLADRKSWNCVCKSWRELARHSRPIPRLPVLFLANLSCSSVRLSGAMTPVRTLDLPFAPENCVGSFDEWMLVLKDSGSSSDAQYMSLNPFTKVSLSFPNPPSWSEVESLQPSKLRKFILIEKTVFFASYFVCQPGEGIPPYDKVVFSAAPDPGSAYVAAVATPESVMLYHDDTWSIYTCEMFNGPKDLLFLEGRLFVLMSSSDLIFAFYLQQEGDVLAVTRIEKLLFKVPGFANTKITKNIIEWQGRILLVLRSSPRTNTWNDVLSISVFQVDLTATHPQYWQLNSLNGDNIFISSTCSKIFPANWHDEIEGNKVLAVDKDLEQVVFNYGIGDAATALVPVNIPAPDLPAARTNLFWGFRE